MLSYHSSLNKHLGGRGGGANWKEEAQLCSNRTKIKRTDNVYIELNEHMEIEITAIEKNILPCTDVATVEA